MAWWPFAAQQMLERARLQRLRRLRKEAAEDAILARGESPPLARPIDFQHGLRWQSMPEWNSCYRRHCAGGVGVDARQ
ncbi:MAG: hypothetical protein ACRD2D_05900 [Terriglobales bacterium]